MDSSFLVTVMHIFESGLHMRVIYYYHVENSYSYNCYWNIF